MTNSSVGYSPRNVLSMSTFASESHLDSAKENGLVPTLWPCELSEGGQRDEGVGH